MEDICDKTMISKYIYNNFELTTPADILLDVNDMNIKKIAELTYKCANLFRIDNSKNDEMKISGILCCDIMTSTLNAFRNMYNVKRQLIFDIVTSSLDEYIESSNVQTIRNDLNLILSYNDDNAIHGIDLKDKIVDIWLNN